MTSKEALTLLIPKDIQTHIDFKNKYGSSIKCFICKDLERLEELEKENQELKNSALELWDKCYTKENSKLKKAIEIIRDKNVNIVYIKIFKDYKLYSQYYTGSSKDILTNEEYELLKEVLRNDK